MALELEPDCAAGKPLRALAVAGTDTKFFERNHRLVCALLDARFDGEASHVGLEQFLGAATTAQHWLLVADLDGGLLPFRQLRVPTSELLATTLPGRRLLIVENEKSLHQLPAMKDTVAVLGAGLDMAWARAQWLQAKEVAYWGGIDTWGLRCLALARAAIPQLTALMMTHDAFATHLQSAVPESVNAGDVPPCELTINERALYEMLLGEERGRLEQEFLPESVVRHEVLSWASRGTRD